MVRGIPERSGRSGADKVYGTSGDAGASTAQQDPTFRSSGPHAKPMRIARQGCVSARITEELPAQFTPLCPELPTFEIDNSGRLQDRLRSSLLLEQDCKRGSSRRLAEPSCNVGSAVCSVWCCVVGDRCVTDGRNSSSFGRPYRSG